VWNFLSHYSYVRLKPLHLQAYVLSEGKKHWRTNNRGKLWQSFEMPVKKAPTASPLGFHADKTKSDYVLFQGVKCEGLIPWTKHCEYEVRFKSVSCREEAGGAF
jgi:hypothetical protein